jgi:hypothetical protein
VKDDALSLAFRTGLPFVGLRDHEHDPELDRFIPPDAARAARVVVLSAGDGHLRLAVADPEADLTALTPYLGDRRVELAVAAHDEVEAILGPPAPLPRVTAQPLDFVEQPPAEPADGEPEQPQPEPVAAEPQAATDGEPLGVSGEAEASEPAAAEPAAAEPQPVPAEREPPAAEPSESEPVATAAEPSPTEPLAAAAEPGEVPSWLEPPRRGRKVVVVLTVLLLLLVVAAGAATAYLLTR